MSAEEPKGKEEKTTACGGFERMFEMMSQCCKGAGSLPDCFSMMRMMEKCCGPRTENKSAEGHG
jgi:uncharacterized metal-binding protein